MHVKRFMTSPKDTYYPRSVSPTLSDSIPSANQHNGSEACPPPVTGYTKLSDCRVLFSLPSLETLEVAPFKGIPVDGSLVAAKIRKWIKGDYKGTHFNISNIELIAPDDLGAVTDKNLTYLADHRPDVIAFLSHLAMLEYKEDLLKTVTTVTQDEAIRSAWTAYLDDMLETAPELELGSVHQSVYMPPGVASARVSKPVQDGKDESEDAKVDTQYLNENVEHRIIENRRIDDLTYAGHKAGERARQIRDEAAAETNRVERWQRHGCTPPPLSKGDYVWVSVVKTDNDADKCEFDLAKVVEGTTDEGDWNDDVKVMWCYRSQPEAGYATPSYFLPSQKQIQTVDRRCIEVDSVEVRGKQRKLVISKKGLEAICSAGIGFTVATGRLIFKALEDARDIETALTEEAAHTASTSQAANSYTEFLKTNVLASLWERRLAAWPCQHSPDPTYVFNEMLRGGKQPIVRDQFVQHCLKLHSPASCKSKIRERHKELATTPSTDNQQLFVDALRLSLWEAWGQVPALSSETWLPVALLHTAEDERDALEQTSVVLDGLCSVRLAEMQQGWRNTLFSDAPFLPWNTVLDRKVAGLCGMFQELGSDDNEWIFVELQLEWNQHSSARKKLDDVLTGGQVRLTTSSKCWSDLPAIALIVANGAEAMLGGKWTVTKRETWSIMDETLSESQQREWTFLRAAFAMKELCYHSSRHTRSKKTNSRSTSSSSGNAASGVVLTLDTLKEWYKSTCTYPAQNMKKVNAPQQKKKGARD